MSIKDLSSSPYFDSYNPAKDYIQLLAIPGRVAQASEFTTMQSILRGIIKSIGDSIMKNGDIVEGCQIIISGTDVTVTSGKVYIEGIVLNVPESVVTISGTGKEFVGVEIEDIPVDEYDAVDGDDVRDPAAGYDNYNQPGCHRLRRTLKVVAGNPADHPESITLANLIDGNLMVENYAPEYDTLSQVLAKRTFEESGSYIVDGLKVRVNNKEGFETDKTYTITVDQGTSYIQGFRVPTGGPRNITVDKSIETAPYYQEFPYSGETLRKIDDSPHVKSITKVTGRMETTEQHSSKSSVSLTYNNAILKSVIENGEDLTENCKIEIDASGNSTLVWVGPTYPTTSYSVTYTYSVEFDNEVDYRYTISDRASCIEWLSSGAKKPSLGTDYRVEYDYYLARKDLVCINQIGMIEVIKGVAANYGEETLPETPLESLVLATIENPPNGSATITDISDAVIIENIGLTRFTMQDIQNILSRVQTMQYDQAVTTLNADAQQVYTENDKKGIFTEPFVDISRIDFAYTDSGVDPTKPLYDMALDLACNICYLPVHTETHDVKHENNLENESNRAHMYKRLISLRTTTDTPAISQLNATGTIPINPYSTFPQAPEVSVTPSVDSWIEDTIIEVPRSITEYAIQQMSTRTIDNRRNYQINNSNYRTTSTTNTVDTAIGTRVSEPYLSSSEIISERAVTYIRKRTITVEGANFSPDLDNIQCYFDDILVPLTPVEGTVVGTDIVGSVKADSKGYVKATFEIPDKVFTGMREVRLKAEKPTIDLLNNAEYTNEGFTFYIAEGLARTIRNTVTTVTTVLQHRVTTTSLSAIYVDPVGQTFVLDRMRVIKGIDVYFSKIPSANIPVVCELRGVTNGMINSTVYAHKSLFPSDIEGKVDAVNGAIATRFNFDDPVLLEGSVEYAFVLRSTSNSYEVWVSELGGVDVTSKNIVLENPYMTGVMFTSSNNSTWTAHQNMDMKFQLIEDIYDTSSEFIFDDIPVEAARLHLSADSVIPQGTKIDWSYSIDGGVNYKTLTPHNITLLKQYYEGNVRLKVVLNRVDASSNLTPLIAIDTISLTASYYEEEGWYVSHNIPDLDPYDQVQIVVETYEPGRGKSTGDGNYEDPLQFYVSTDAEGSTNTKKLLVEEKSRPLTYNWVERNYKITGLNDATQCRIFVKASSNVKYLTPSFRKMRVIMS